MKKRYLFLLLIGATLSITTALLTSNIDGKLCSLGNNNKSCPKKTGQSPKTPKKQPQGSSPDEIHYGGFNRLIVSTFR